MIKSYYIAAAAASLCLLLITVAVSSTVYILNDISNFYIEAQDELVEFKNLANNAWDYMTYDASPEELREAEKMEKQIEERVRRSYEPAQIENYGRLSATTRKPDTVVMDEEVNGYDSVPSQDVGPPSSRPRKPNPPTMPRVILGFKAPPPAATSTYRPPPSDGAYDNYGREPASSRRPIKPTIYSGTPLPYKPINTGTRVNIPNPTQPPPRPASAAPRTQPPYQPNGGYDGGKLISPNWSIRNNPQSTTPSAHGSYPEDAQPINPNTPKKSYETDRTPYGSSTQKPQYENPRVRVTEETGPPNIPQRVNESKKGPAPKDTQEPKQTPGNQQVQIPNHKPGYDNNSETPRPRPMTNQRTDRPKPSNQCDMCGQQPNTCPPGPPGPRGRPGPPGFPGQDGPRGLRGLNGGYVDPNPSTYPEDIGCIQCPIGAPGNPGPDGPMGPTGEDGQDGEQGTNGNDGEPGAPGAPGYHGMPGIPGRPGKPGTPGRKGQACRSIPGPPGRPGTIGIPGRPGDPGIDGEHGQDGTPGIQGPPGKDGLPGPDGPQGDSRPGSPGTDGGYCSCPKRSSKFEFRDDYNNVAPQRTRPREYLPEATSEQRPPRPQERTYDEHSDYERPQRRPHYDTATEMERQQEYSEKPRYERPTDERKNNYVNIDNRKSTSYEHPDRSNQERNQYPEEKPPPPPRRYEQEEGSYRPTYTDDRRPYREEQIEEKKEDKQSRGANPERRSEYEETEAIAPKNNAHPPGIRRPKNDATPVKSPRYDGEKYEDISMPKETKSNPLNKGQEREWNQNEEPKNGNSEYTSDRKPDQDDYRDNTPLPSEQYYRRKTRFYQTRYYDKYLL